MQVEFEIERITGGHLNRVDGFLGQQCPAQIGVQHGTGEVEHPPHPAGMLAGQALAGPAGQYLGAQFDGIKLTKAGRFAQVIEQLAQRGKQGFTAIALGQRLAGGAAQQAVDGRQVRGCLGWVGRHQRTPACVCRRL
ncbi:hypothetical protein D3C84_426260 [compost metagenome]